MSRREMTLTEFLLARIANDEAWWDSARFTGPSGYGLRARMRADVLAKRAIVALHDPAPFGLGIDPDDPRLDPRRCSECGDCDYPVDWPCPTLRLLAAVYSDHPDYDEAWRA